MNYLIAGLGNIGEEYVETRHNIGFEVVERLAKDFEVDWESERLAYKTYFRYKGRGFHLIKPTTFMNLSGKAVKYWLTKLKIKQEQLLVIMDDLALPYGKIRLRLKGSDAGHNGLKNIDLLLGNNKYARLRFGIGDNFSRGKQIQYVLGKWTNDEFADLPPLIEKASEAIVSFATIGSKKTMEVFNQK